MTKANVSSWKEEFKEIFVDSVIFPLSTSTARILSTGLTGIASQSDLLLGYVITATMHDLVDLLNRVYIKCGPEGDFESMGRKPFYCFEKRLFYDLPKYLEKKIQGGREE